MPSFTNLYWASDKYTHPRSYDIVNVKSNHLGIDFDMVKQDPVSAGYYFNQNQVTQPVKLNKGFQPEYFRGGDRVIPTVAGKPRVDPSLYKFSRT